MIVTGRDGRESVEAQVENYAQEFRVVREIMEVFKASRDDLSVKRSQAEVHRRSYHTRIAVIILVAALSLAATIFFS